MRINAEEIRVATSMMQKGYKYLVASVLTDRLLFAKTEKDMSDLIRTEFKAEDTAMALPLTHVLLIMLQSVLTTAEQKDPQPLPIEVAHAYLLDLAFKELTAAVKIYMARNSKLAEFRSYGWHEFGFICHPNLEQLSKDLLADTVSAVNPLPREYADLEPIRQIMLKWSESGCMHGTGPGLDSCCFTITAEGELQMNPEPDNYNLIGF